LKKATFDWRGLEAAAVDHMVTAVRRVRDACPHESLYGALFHAFYGDGESIYWPSLAVGSEESLARVVSDYRQRGSPATAQELRWSPADLPYNVDPDAEHDDWARACCTFASRDGTFSEWEAVYERFLHVFPRAAKKARRQLVSESVVDKHFIAVAADEAGDLIPLSLTTAQISHHFPEYDIAAQARLRLAALPQPQRLAELTAHAVGAAENGVLYGEYEQLLKASGKEAVPFLAAVIRGEQPGNAWKASMLLAEINEPIDEAIAALVGKLDDAKASNSDRCWAACALARLGHMPLLTARMPQLPPGIVAPGLAAPYSAFRDRGRHPPLDYRPLEAALARYPQLADAVAEELSPGSGFCTIDKQEKEAAQAGCGSSWAFIRQHAAWVLETLEEG